MENIELRPPVPFQGMPNTKKRKEPNYLEYFKWYQLWNKSTTNRIQESTVGLITIKSNRTDHKYYFLLNAEHGYITK